MFDPATITVAVSTATSAFNAIKRAMDAGREIETISKDLNRWMSAVSDVDNIKKQSENPSLFRKLLSGNQIEQMAFESIQAKRLWRIRERHLRTISCSKWVLVIGMTSLQKKDV